MKWRSLASLAGDEWISWDIYSVWYIRDCWHWKKIDFCFQPRNNLFVLNGSRDKKKDFCSLNCTLIKTERKGLLEWLGHFKAPFKILFSIILSIHSTTTSRTKSGRNGRFLLPHFSRNNVFFFAFFLHRAIMFSNYVPVLWIAQGIKANVFAFFSEAFLLRGLTIKYASIKGEARKLFFWGMNIIIAPNSFFYFFLSYFSTSPHDFERKVQSQ